jgi:uncharacterized RDD family membrane protein YckC/cytoskeletal protein CcmA (bactofilin family)
MKSPYKALRAALLLAALIPFAAAYADDPAKPQDNAAPEAPLHEIGAPTEAPAAATPTPSPTAADTRIYRPDTVVHQFDDEDNNRVSVGDATYVGPGETVKGNAVAVMGPVTVDGTVNGNSVSVMGTNTINGTVHGNAVVVLGTLRVGPHAHVDGNVVAGVGVVIKEPGAVIGGNVVQQGSKFNFSENSGAFSWWEHAFKRGRPMAFGPHLHAFWILSICTVALYVLLALVFPGGVTKCGETLVERPGMTILTGILAIVALPVVFVLVFITIVGIPIALVVLPLLVMACITFGKASLYALVGRSILGKSAHPVLCVLLGVAIIIGFFLVPLLGGLIWIIMAFLGYACAVTTLFTPKKKAPLAGSPPSASVPAATVPPAAMALAEMPPELAPAMPPPLAAPAQPAPAAVPAPLSAMSEAALPRAGFWIRMVAIFIDVLLVGIVTRMHDWFPVALAIYGALLWKLRGATVGDIIFGLKVVRADGSPMEWVTVIVRALACFFSVIVAGLGFIWIAFDREKQGWHDKIAGTVVVHLPKGSPLV